MRKCIKCGKTSKTLFQFPIDETNLKLWCDNLNIQTSSILKSSRVCELHFEENHIVRKPTINKLIFNALPKKTINEEECFKSWNDFKTQLLSELKEQDLKWIVNEDKNGLNLLYLEKFNVIFVLTIKTNFSFSIESSKFIIPNNNLV